MHDLVDALRYVRETGYVPWSDERERALTEKMLADDLIEFLPRYTRVNSLVRQRWAREGRYFLTLLGRRHLATLITRSG